MTANFKSEKTLMEPGESKAYLEQVVVKPIISPAASKKNHLL